MDDRTTIFVRGEEVYINKYHIIQIECHYKYDQIGGKINFLFWNVVSGWDFLFHISIHILFVMSTICAISLLLLSLENLHFRRIYRICILLVLIHSINIIIIITVIRRMFAYDVASTELLLRSLVKHIERHDFACYSIADVKIFLNKKQQCIHETWSEKKIRYTSKDFSALEQMTANRLEREWVGVASNKAEK